MRNLRCRGREYLVQDGTTNGIRIGLVMQCVSGVFIPNSISLFINKQEVHRGTLDTSTSA